MVLCSLRFDIPTEIIEMFVTAYSLSASYSICLYVRIYVTVMSLDARVLLQKISNLSRNRYD